MVRSIIPPSDNMFGPNGRYRVSHRIGRGGYGEVFRCSDVTQSSHNMHVRGGRRLACKRIIEKKRTEALYKYSMDALKNEIRVMQYLKRSYPGGHPNLVGLEDCSEKDSDNPFLVMQLCDGGDLCSFIDKSTGGRLAESMARKVMLSLMTAIDACHRQGVMHGDIKPDNALLMEEISTSTDAHVVDVIKLKLCDFGLSRHLKAGETCSRVVGTVPYMAPEVFSGRRGLEADIWAAGVTLHYMLSGQLPFEGETVEEVYEQQMQSKSWHFFFTSAQWESVSGEAKDVIKSMLSFHTWERASVKDFLQHPWVTGLTPAPRLARRHLPLSIPPAVLMGSTIAAY